MKTFILYRSSAGSGKTRTLAKEYLKLALRNKAYYFRHILAVTFANKATQEMKDRILEYLGRYADGQEDELSGELKKELRQDDVTFRQNCTELRSEILHHYDLFSISTIDAFFQKVIRSFTRETSLMGDYRLEVDQDAVLEEVIKSLIDELGDNELTKWVVAFAKENLENDKPWDIRASLMEFAKEIFREEFKAIEDEVRKQSADPNFFKTLKDRLWKVKGSFLAEVSKPAAEILQIIDSKGWEDVDFTYQRNSGIFTFFRQFAQNKILSSYKKPSDRMRLHYAIPKNWPHKMTRHHNDILQISEKEIIPRLKQIISIYDNQFIKALSAEVVLQNMYVFGLMSDIARKLQDYKTENNLMLLADAPKLLNGIIQDSDTPFIYEKIGSFYRHYLIDEFQDTSGFQWKNFLPLLTNGLDQGFQSMVVGDVKQAIYRWRGGDLRLLQQDVESRIGKDRVEVKELDRNFRSAKNIIGFNNALFKTISTRLSAEGNSVLPEQAYHDVRQETSKDVQGFVRINFFDDEEDGRKWKDQALDHMAHQLERLQHQGVALSDIAILVRLNSEGQRIASHLLQYKNSDKALSDCKYEVVSNESLRMDGAASVNLLLGALRYLSNTDDPIARAQLSFEYSRLHVPQRSYVDVFTVNNQPFFEGQLPEKFTKEKMSLKKLPLFELTETLISIFELGKEKGELAYLLAFQDLVLEFYSRERNDVDAFLEWWEENKHKERTSIKISGEVDAVKILTIHKAKGLQFKYVLVPFCAWYFDHSKTMAPNLWVKTDDPLLADAGFTPVNYSSVLDQSFFQESYLEEKNAVYLDNLNLLYVALTRAEEGMILMAPAKGKSGGTVGKWLLEALEENEELVVSWNKGSQEFSVGDWPVVETQGEKKIPDSLALREYFSYRWREALVIRQSGSTFFEEIQPDQRNKINYGIHLHTILSRIKYKSECNEAIDQLLREGMIHEEERIAIQQQLDKLMEHKTVAPWFSEEWDVRTEVPILLPGGFSNRIDRLLIRGERAVVIDFKTGEKSKADQKQVLEYMDILKQMNFKEVEGYLLYTRDQEIIALNDGGKQKVVKKKKNDNQLGLGFE